MPDSYFLIYNKANTAGGQPAKIVSWVNLTDDGLGRDATKVTTAIDTVGAANLARVDQFDWWKSEANVRQNRQARRTPSQRRRTSRSSPTPTTWPPTAAGA